jgi:hypothetical protein
MATKWWNNREEEGVKEETSAKSDLRSIEIKPEIITAAVKPHLDSMRTELSSTMDEKLKPMNDFFAEQNRQRAEAARRQQVEAENVDELDYATDPAAAIDKKLAPLIRNQQAANAMLMINETIGEMELYKNPEFKAKVLAKINSQPLQLRSNAEIILNCYKLIAFDEKEAIQEGKYRSAVGAASTSGTGGHSGSSKSESEVTISDEEKVYARKMGISDENWVKSKKTLEFV